MSVKMTTKKEPLISHLAVFDGFLPPASATSSGPMAVNICNFDGE
jgi:hypothetical protein